MFYNMNSQLVIVEHIHVKISVNHKNDSNFFLKVPNFILYTTNLAVVKHSSHYKEDSKMFITIVLGSPHVMLHSNS